MSTFQIASYNLYQYAAPGTFWYEVDENNDYEPHQWAAKEQFIRDMLRDLDSDVIGFQEVFSAAEFRALLNDAGYPHVEILEDPPFDQETPDAPKVFRGPVNALASRHPILNARVLPSTPETEPDGQLSADSGFRRGIIEAEIAIPGLESPLAVYVCHLKSKGAFVDTDGVEALPDWPSRWRRHLRERALKDANQVIRRASEAMMLYEAVMNRIEANPLQPVVVMGDLNDTPDSFTLRILTQNEEVANIARRRARDLEVEERAPQYQWKLYSAAVLGSPQSLTPPPTHAGWNHASTLDYVLVSNALNHRNPAAVAHCKRFDVFNDHHWDRTARLQSSDHAPVRARFEIVPTG